MILIKEETTIDLSCSAYPHLMFFIRRSNPEAIVTASNIGSFLKALDVTSSCTSNLRSRVFTLRLSFSTSAMARPLL